MSDIPPQDSLIEYPCDFPVKIMGKCEDGFAQDIAQLVLAVDPGFDPLGMEMRASSKGNYLSLTCTVHVSSREQLDGLYRALTAHPLVRVVL